DGGPLVRARLAAGLEQHQAALLEREQRRVRATAHRREARRDHRRDLAPPPAPEGGKLLAHGRSRARGGIAGSRGHFATPAAAGALAPSAGGAAVDPPPAPYERGLNGVGRITATASRVNPVPSSSRASDRIPTTPVPPAP